MNKWQVNIKIWQVNIKIWQDDIKIWQVNLIIWQVMAEICHHMCEKMPFCLNTYNFDKLLPTFYTCMYHFIILRIQCHVYILVSDYYVLYSLKLKVVPRCHNMYCPSLAFNTQHTSSNCNHRKTLELLNFQSDVTAFACLFD